MNPSWRSVYRVAQMRDQFPHCPLDRLTAQLERGPFGEVIPPVAHLPVMGLELGVPLRAVDVERWPSVRRSPCSRTHLLCAESASSTPAAQKHRAARRRLLAMIREYSREHRLAKPPQSRTSDRSSLKGNQTHDRRRPVARPCCKSTSFTYKMPVGVVV